ncbi:MAG: SufE family protein [Gemmatimonadaceae bacterium]
MSVGVPGAIERVLARFRAMSRSDKMQALVQYSRKLEPVPERYAEVDRTDFVVPECQTRVDIFPEVHDGRMHFYADVNVRQSPTVAAVLAVVFAAVNDQPPSVTLGIPSDFVRTLMEGMGLHTRETGLNAMIGRLKRAASAAEGSAEPAALRRADPSASH